MLAEHLRHDARVGVIGAPDVGRDHQADLFAAIERVVAVSGQRGTVAEPTQCKR